MPEQNVRFLRRPYFLFETNAVSDGSDRLIVSTGPVSTMNSYRVSTNAERFPLNAGQHIECHHAREFGRGLGIWRKGVVC